MQYGNFQSGAFALTVAGMLAVTRGGVTWGTAALAFAAASKLFPGLLVALLVGTRRYGAAAMTAAWMLGLALLALVLFGPRPYTDFVFYQVPAISSGSGFGWSQMPMLIPTNYGVSGAILKIGALGAPGITFDRAMQAASVYGVAVTALALFAAWRLWRGEAREASMAGGPLLWLAILNLASFRSPYVADAQATMGTLWALSLLLATVRPSGWRLALAVIAWISWSATFEGLTPRQHSTPLLIFTLMTQVGAFAFNAALVLRQLRKPARVVFNNSVE